MTAEGGFATRRSFAVLYAVLLSVAAGNTALLSVMPAVSRTLGLPDFVAVAVFSVSATFWMVSAPYWATKSDSWGRRPLIMLGMVGFTLSMAMIGILVFAGLVGGVDAAIVAIGLIAARGLFGLTGSASFPAAQAWVADNTSREQRTPALSRLAAAIGLGTVIGPAVAPILIFAPVGPAGPFLVFTCVGLGVLLAIWRLLPADRMRRPAISADANGGPFSPSFSPWRDKRSGPLLAYAFAFGSVQSITIQVLGFLVIDRSGLPPLEAQPKVAVVYLAGALAALFAQLMLVERLKLGPSQLMRWGAGLGCAGMIMLVVATDLAGIMLAYGLFSLGFGFGRPGFTAAASLVVGPDHQGAMAGALAAVLGASALLPPLAGIALYALWPSGPFALGAAVLATLLAATLLFNRQ